MISTFSIPVCCRLYTYNLLSYTPSYSMYQVKEELCFVSLDLIGDLKRTKPQKSKNISGLRPFTSHHTLDTTDSSPFPSSSSSEPMDVDDMPTTPTKLPTASEGRGKIHREPLQPLKQAFVLPDFQTLNRGYVKPVDETAKDNEQVIRCFFVWIL